MIEHVLENVRPKRPHSVTVVCQREHYDHMRFLEVDRLVAVDGVTEGAACTLLKATEGLDKDSELMVANSDQLLDWEPDEFLKAASRGYRGCIALFPGDGSKKWSYADYDGELINRIAEKDPISDWATCGVYWWWSVRQFEQVAQEMIAANERVNGEFYIAPVFNRMPGVRGYPVKSMTGLGTPEDLERYVGGTTRMANPVHGPEKSKEAGEDSGERGRHPEAYSSRRFAA